jgi:hypothetical protein
VQALKELPYAKRREDDAGDTIRVYVLRLREARIIKRCRDGGLEQGDSERSRRS